MRDTGEVCVHAEDDGERAAFVFVNPESGDARALVIDQCWGESNSYRENPVSYESHWVALDRCHVTPEGVLGDNPYHPNLPTWFADRLEDVASCCGLEAEYLQALLCSAHAVERFGGHQALAAWFGWGEFDCYPLVDSTPRDRRLMRRKMARWTEEARNYGNAQRKLAAVSGIAEPLIRADWHDERGESILATLCRTA